MRRRFAIAVVALSTLASPALAETLRFTGQTTADQTLIKDTLRAVQEYIVALKNCSVIMGVDATILASSYAPSDAKYRVAPKETYERWVVEACGSKTSFLIGYWPAEDGGMNFNVSYPLPKDAQPTP